MNKKGVWLKVSIVIALVVVLSVINIMYIDISPASFSDWLANFPVLAPVIFLGLYIVRTFFLFPITIFYITGGIAFGALEATLYAAIGGTIGAIIMYALSRYFDFDVLLKKYTGRRIKNIQEQLEQNGFMYIFLLRNVPIANYDLISYAAGASSVPFGQFVLGTFFGSIPMAYLYGYIGFSFGQGEYYQGIIITIIVLVATLISVRYMKRQQKKRSATKG
ncbi:TVP38/TMEM64 family protein [Desulfuribacillus alkaliarsenatis]|uniref:TVP38/TMEM64 family membrane protein n=1 Tax=Desulfuribacillus alkaliarsenatis TaxID=766136 RepID=A0A1E5G0T2_9FIRM|nr:TVP38/TMEM64 family protein [Desulfuribacillus alkaliarsenatis]OEF96516.1 hypothetical protein BHF68_07640 [Desulfuribacillus alkaliarsenatis]